MSRADLPAEWPAPAKLNLFLHVTGRRADGYHTLQTVFRFLDLEDTLRFTPRADGAIRRVRDLPGVPAEADLCVRAARALQQATGCALGADIALDKRIPLGGGLGGGSSDAATTLLALNALWGTGLDIAQLAGLGLGLGADLPVFLHGRAAWGEGVGERLTPLDLPPAHYVLLAPPVTVATARIFAALELTACSRAITIRDFHAGRGRNDLEPVARRLYPKVDKALKWLDKFGNARMTGSGGCVYLEVDDAERGREIAAACPPELAKAWVARGVDVHPLMNWGVAKR
ncbi:MAG TPA: 4-(cytidine 5'-diphospho)-2-C-methyl-D-erythritol kinase [Acidiferrobacterales bacterium]